MAKKKNDQMNEALGSGSSEALLKRERKANSAWAKLRRNKTAMVGLIIVLVMIFLAVFAPCSVHMTPTRLIFSTCI